MDERVARLTTPEDCEQFAINVEARGDPGDRELAIEARRRAVQLRAVAYGAANNAELEALQAIFAYERGLLIKHRGKHIRAVRTWRMIRNRGIINAVEEIVTRERDSLGYTVLVEEGMEDMSFEAVVLRHQDVFSPEAVRQSRERLDGWVNGERGAAGRNPPDRPIPERR